MSINVSVPLEALENPDVARALSQLMLSLGGVSTSRSIVAKPKPEPVAETPAKTRAPRRAATRQAAAAPAAKAEGRNEQQRYHDFVDNLPDPSRHFLDLIKKHGNLRLSQAVRELGITRPKTLGGITGSLTRWAKQRGIELPYKAGKTPDGERVWTWTRGVDGSAATGKRARARRRGGARGSNKQTSKESEPARAVVESRPDVTGPALLEDDRYGPLVEGMNDTARRFLVALSERGSLTMTEALDAVERKRAKSIGDAVRAYRFRGSEKTLKLPFEERATHTGERMWIWTGLVPRKEPETKPDSPGVIVIRGGRDRTARSA